MSHLRQLKCHHNDNSNVMDRICIGKMDRKFIGKMDRISIGKMG